MTLKQENDFSATPNYFDVTPLEAKLVEKSSGAEKHIIHQGQSLEVQISNFVQTGLLPSWGAFAGWNYKTKVYIERMGDDYIDVNGVRNWYKPTPSPELTTPFVAGSLSHDYTSVDPLKVEIQNLTEGAFKVVVTCNLYSPSNDDSPFHSFAELGLIEVVKAM